MAQETELIRLGAVLHQRGINPPSRSSSFRSGLRISVGRCALGVPVSRVCTPAPGRCSAGLRSLAWVRNPAGGLRGREGDSRMRPPLLGNPAGLHLLLWTSWERWEVEELTCFPHTRCPCTSGGCAAGNSSGPLWFYGREAGVGMAFVDSQLCPTWKVVFCFCFPASQLRKNPVEKSWISGLYQNKCIWGSQINIVRATLFLYFLNFKCLTLDLINIHRVFSSFTFCYCYGKLWLPIKYYEQSRRNPQVIGKYINLFQISLYLSLLVLEASDFKAELQIVSAC